MKNTYGVQIIESIEHESIPINMLKNLFFAKILIQLFKIPLFSFHNQLKINVMCIKKTTLSENEFLNNSVNIHLL